MKLNNINLKKVIPIALLTVVLLIVVVYFAACGNKNKNEDETTKTVSNQTTEEQTTGNTVIENETSNNNGNGSIFDYVGDDYTSDVELQTTLTAGENQTSNNGEKATTSKKPVKDEKDTTSVSYSVDWTNNPTKPSYQQTTTTNNNGNTSSEQQTTGNGVVEAGLDVYEIEETETYIPEEEKTFYAVREAYRWYNLYANGTKEWDMSGDPFTYNPLQYMSFKKIDKGDYYAVSIDMTDYTYKYTKKFEGATGTKTKKVYDNYYIDKYAEKSFDINGDYVIYCGYYIEKKTNVTYKNLTDLYVNKVASDAVESLGTTSSSMSKEKKICLITEYVNANSSINYDIEKATTIVNALNKSGVNAYLTEHKNYGEGYILVQMEDNLWYNISFGKDIKGNKTLDMEFVIASEYKSVPNGAVFATHETANLVFKRLYPNSTGSYIIAFSDITY